MFDELKIRDYKVAFENAIARGMKNVEDWMYMYSDEKYDYFKNECTRSYKKIRYKKIF